MQRRVNLIEAATASAAWVHGLDRNQPSSAADQTACWLLKQFPRAAGNTVAFMQVQGHMLVQQQTPHIDACWQGSQQAMDVQAARSIRKKLKCTGRGAAVVGYTVWCWWLQCRQPVWRKAAAHWCQQHTLLHRQQLPGGRGLFAHYALMLQEPPTGQRPGRISMAHVAPHAGCHAARDVALVRVDPNRIVAWEWISKRRV